MKKILISIIIGLLALVIVGATAGYYWLTTPAHTPTLAIQKYIIHSGHPLKLLNMKIESTNFTDETYGQQFIAEYVNDSITFFYLKQSNKGWYVVSAGTGP